MTDDLFLRTFPNGQVRTFPGCFRCREILERRKAHTVLERTAFYRRLAALEMNYLRKLPVRPAKVRLPLAEMIRRRPPGAKPK